MSRTRFLITWGLGILLTLVLVAIAAVEVTNALHDSSPSVKTLQSSIARDVEDQSMSLALTADRGPPSADVACPRHASLNKGSVFFCTATITLVSTDPNAIGGTRINSWTRRLRVTMLAGGKAQWHVVPAGATLAPS